jgi:hypothetical protein
MWYVDVHGTQASSYNVTKVFVAFWKRQFDGTKRVQLDSACLCSYAFDTVPCTSVMGVYTSRHSLKVCCICAYVLVTTERRQGFLK